MSFPTLYIVRNSSIKEDPDSVQVACVLFTLKSGSVPSSTWVLLAYLKPCVKTSPDRLYFLTVIELIEGHDAHLLQLIAKVDHWSRLHLFEDLRKELSR
jgi:hypothetical protein